MSTVIPGLTLNAAARTITGTPTAASPLQNFAWAARDADDDMNTSDRALLIFSITVSAATVDAIPAFANGETIPTQDFTVGVPIMPLTLPRATGGDGALTYTITPAIPGLTLNPTTGVLTGTPTTAATLATYRYTVTDMDGDTATITFRITIEAAGTDTAPTFGGATISAQNYIAGTAITAVTLPVATGGDGAITYTLTPALPTGLTFNAATRTITGTASAAATVQTFTYTATDTANATATLMFSITIDAADTAPAFADGAAVSAQTFTIGTAVDLTLPVATGGNGAITYTLTPAIPGLTLNPATGVLTGTPTTEAGATMHTYTAGDTDGSAAGTDEVSLMFSITVIQAPPTEIRLSVNPAEVTESTTATTITVTATLIDGTYAAERTITIASTDGTATAGTDYTAVPDTVLTIPANATSGTVDIMLTTVVDTVAEPGGETVSIERSSTTGTGAVDSDIPVSSATLTINDYTPVTVNAGPDRTIGYGATIRLNGEIMSAASATVVITWALSDSAAARTALEAAGLTPAEATTEVTRLTTALAGLTADRTFPAPAADLGLTDHRGAGLHLHGDRQHRARRPADIGDKRDG